MLWSCNSRGYSIESQIWWEIGLFCIHFAWVGYRSRYRLTRMPQALGYNANVKTAEQYGKAGVWFDDIGSGWIGLELYAGLVVLGDKGVQEPRNKELDGNANPHLWKHSFCSRKRSTLNPMNKCSTVHPGFFNPPELRAEKPFLPFICMMEYAEKKRERGTKQLYWIFRSNELWLFLTQHNT